MAGTIETIAGVAAVVSAFGSAFAAIGAMRSASSARQAQMAAERSEKRAALRELVISGNELDVELQRVVARAMELKTGYQTYFCFSGSSQHSSEALLLAEIEKSYRRPRRLLKR